MHALPFSQAGSTEGGQNQNVSIQNPCLFYVLRNGDNFPGNNFLKVFPLSSESMMNFPHWRREKTENSHPRHKSGPAPLSQLLSSVLDHRGMGVCVWLSFSFIFVTINFCSSSKLGAKLYFTACLSYKTLCEGNIIASMMWVRHFRNGRFAWSQYQQMEHPGS